MIALVACLSVGLALALGAILCLAVTLPRRMMRLVVAEVAKTEHALTEKTAIKQATAVQVAGMVHALRVYHDESALLAEWAPAEIERIDTLAGRRDLTRAEMIASLVRRSLEEEADGGVLVRLKGGGGA